MKKNFNKKFNKIRVNIECFFGRMQKIFTFTKRVYPFDHKNFDIDIDNCILLTNEHIRYY